MLARQLGEVATEAKVPVVLSDLRVRTPKKQLVPFIPNEVQVKYLDDLSRRHPEFTWREDGPTPPTYMLRGLRDDILKSRQQGFSTLWLALYFLDTINTPFTQSIIIAHDAPATEKLFKIIHRFYEHLPEEKKRPKKYSTKREIEFSDIDSGIYVATAGSKGVGRGGTINNVHMSERAFWPEGADVEVGLLEAVPLEGNATRETTANGLNEYHEERVQVQEGKSHFHGVFFGWFEKLENSIPAPANFQIERGTWIPNKQGIEEYHESEEEKLVRRFHLTNDQLEWRRSKRRTSRQRELFPQENPATEDEAFLSSGNPYFDLEKLDELAQVLKDAKFNPLPVVDVPEKYATLRRNREGLEVWQLPQPNAVYVIGADTAEGINTHGDHDFDSASVWDAATGIQVAHLHGRWDTHTYGLMLAELGFWFNTALLGIERNNHGHAVLNSVRYSANYPEALNDTSTGLYMHQEYDEKQAPRERKAGYPTTKVTKPFILDELATAIEEGDFHPRSRLLVADAMRFVKMAGGKAGAETGHDDRVMDAAIARRMLNLRPRKVTNPAPRKSYGF